MKECTAGRRIDDRATSRVGCYVFQVIDTHCHLTFPDFDGRIGEVLDSAQREGVAGCITISTTTVDCLSALRIAKSDRRVWCTSGVHPLYADQGPHDWAAIKVVGADPRCVAWGELGLDNHYPQPGPKLQREVLETQLSHLQSWAAEGLVKPVVVHCREAFDDLLPVLRSVPLSPERFVFHCFTGTPADVRKVLDFGAMVSFTGVVTYRNASGVREAARLVPIDRIMVETDAPFLSPEPKRGVRPCEPWMARLTAQNLAALRGESWGDFHAAIVRNAERFFGIDEAMISKPAG